MKTEALNCPNCGGPLALPKERTNKCFCPSCGTPVLIDDGQVYINVNTTHTVVNKEIKETIDHGKEAISDMVAFIVTFLILALLFFVIMYVIKRG